MNTVKRADILHRLYGDNPEPRTGLTYTTPFELPIAVVLSTQTVDVGVNKATVRPYPATDIPEVIHTLSVERLSGYIRTIDPYNNKARNVVEACHILIEKHGDRVLDNHEDLEALPGIGHKTASAMFNTTFRQLVMAADTYIFRVADRTGIAPRKNVLEVKKRLLKFVPREYLSDAHHRLILHSRCIYKACKP